VLLYVDVVNALIKGRLRTMCGLKAMDVKDRYGEPERGE
jgi:hypothetical protein